MIQIQYRVNIQNKQRIEKHDKTQIKLYKTRSKHINPRFGHHWLSV